MRIGLVQVDGKLPNVALLKLAAWHRAQGDAVEIAAPLLGSYDRVYRSQIFDFSAPDPYLYGGAEIIDGGSGVDLQRELAPEVEACVPAYDLMGVDYAIGHATRGCPRRCRFCVVPRKEGPIRVVGDLRSFWTGQENVLLLDNNLTGAPAHLELIVRQALELGVRLNVTQGFDARLIDRPIADLLRLVKWWRSISAIHVAWDSVRDEAAVVRGIEHLIAAGFSRSHIMVYVLVGYDSSPEDDLYRLERIRALGVRPFVMPFNKADPYQAAIGRWANRPQLFMSCSFAEYRSVHRWELGRRADGGLV